MGGALKMARTIRRRASAAKPSVPLPPTHLRAEEFASRISGAIPFPTAVAERAPAAPSNAVMRTAQAYVDPSRLISRNLFTPYNPSLLVSRKGMAIYDEMKKDEQVKSALAFKKTAALSAGWEVVSPGDQPDDWEVTTFVRDAFTQFKGGWHTALKKMLRALDYGYCLHGDTLIHTLNGNVKISELVGQRPWVFSWDGERVRLGQATRVWLTKRDAQCVRVSYFWYAGGKRLMSDIVCTPEHPIMLRDGTYRKAGDLRADDRLMPFSQKATGERAFLQVARGYGRSVWRRRSHWVMEELGHAVAKTNHVHHENGHKLDDRPENLRVMDGRSHAAEHSARWFAEATPEQRAQRSQRIREARAAHADELSAMISEANRKSWADPVVRAKRIAGMLGKQHHSGWKHSDAAREKISAAKRAYWEAKRQPDNHTVISVDPAGTADVYDMEVPGFHNFSANNIVVHNSVTEKVFADGQGVFEGKLVLDRLVELKPHYIDFTTDASGKVKSIDQMPVAGQQGNGSFHPLKFVHYVYDKEFENAYGKADLEAAYRPWWIKDNAYKWFSVMLERYGMSPLFAMYDPNQYSGNTLEELKKVVRNIQNATMGIIPRQNGNEGLEFWSQNLAGNSKEIFLSAMGRFDSDIAKALLQPTMLGFAQESGAYGPTSGGSLARSNVSWRSFMMVVEELQRDLADDAINGQIIPQLCDLNYAGLKSYPVFRFMRLDNETEADLFRMWSELVAGKIVNRIEDDEQHIRKQLGFPPNDAPVLEELPGDALSKAKAEAPEPMPGEKPIPVDEKELSEAMRAFAEENDGVWYAVDGAFVC